MKQFNLDEYLANPTKRLITRDGREVKRVLCTDIKSQYPIVVVIENRDGNTEVVVSLTKDGKYFDNSSDNNDLFFASEKHEGWINIYKSNDTKAYFGDEIYQRREDAEEMVVDRTYIATVKIEWEE